MNLTCIPKDAEKLDHNFVEVETGHRGHSTGTPLSVRDIEDKLVIVLHDRVAGRGCLATCGADDGPCDSISASAFR